MKRIAIALLVSLAGCAQLPSGQQGLAQTTLNVKCADGVNATFNAPFGLSLGTIVADCKPDGQGGWNVTVQNGYDAMLTKLVAGGGAAALAQPKGN